MKKIIFTALTIFLAAGLAFAQADSQGNSSLADPNPNNVGADSAASALREVSLEKFERDGAWNIHISPDHGIANIRLFEGAPAAKQPLEG
ncbi:MAG: flagellar filament protein FlaA, partial [Treponema sp.]|nr:flagellar filament protein FlaA [Treponema sp.]